MQNCDHKHNLQGITNGQEFDTPKLRYGMFIVKAAEYL